MSGKGFYSIEYVYKYELTVYRSSSNRLVGKAKTGQMP